MITSRDVFHFLCLRLSHEDYLPCGTTRIDGFCYYYMQSTSKTTCKDERHGNQCQSITTTSYPGVAACSTFNNNNNNNNNNNDNTMTMTMTMTMTITVTVTITTTIIIIIIIIIIMLFKDVRSQKFPRTDFFKMIKLC